MASRRDDKHGWVRDALADHGKSQKDLATAWGVDGAIVTRFIKTGEPELSMSRAEITANMIGMAFEEFRARIKEGLAPRTRAPLRPIAPAVARAQERATGAPDETREALAALREAVDRAQRALPPGSKIDLSIKLNDEG